MSVHVLNDHGVIHFGPRDAPRQDKYWAERGLIHHEDTFTGEYNTMPVVVFLRRLKAVSDMLANSPATLAKNNFAHHDEIERQQKFVELGVELAKRAREQGMPGDRDAVKEAKRRRKLTMVMPGADSKYTF